MKFYRSSTDLIIRSSIAHGQSEARAQKQCSLFWQNIPVERYPSFTKIVRCLQFVCSIPSEPSHTMDTSGNLSSFFRTISYTLCSLLTRATSVCYSRLLSRPYLSSPGLRHLIHPTQISRDSDARKLAYRMIVICTSARWRCACHGSSILFRVLSSTLFSQPGKKRLVVSGKSILESRNAHKPRKQPSPLQLAL